MPTFQTECLNTVVKNISGGEIYVNFLPPHGRTLDADEEFTVFGGLDSLMGNIDRGGRERIAANIADMVNLGLIEITPPKPLVRDNVTDALRQLVTNSGTVASEPACTTESE